MPITPPRCKICGESEWGHRCRGGPKTVTRARELEQNVKAKQPKPSKSPVANRRIKKGRH